MNNLLQKLLASVAIVGVLVSPQGATEKKAAVAAENNDFDITKFDYKKFTDTLNELEQIIKGTTQEIAAQAPEPEKKGQEMTIEPTTEHGNCPNPVNLGEFRKGIYNKVGSKTYIIQYNNKYFTISESSFDTFSSKIYDKIEFFSNSQFVKNSPFKHEKCFYKNSYQGNITSGVYSITPYQPKTPAELSKAQKAISKKKASNKKNIENIKKKLDSIKKMLDKAL